MPHTGATKDTKLPHQFLPILMVLVSQQQLLAVIIQARMVKIIQNYSLHEQIGEGEYGKVYKGVDSKTKREVAVKVINVNKFKENQKLEECTLNEIEVLSKIESPYIVRFIEILKTANNFYFFYEFCNEGTLQQRIKKSGPLNESLVLTYLSQILEAFRLLAAKNIMHRDLKPSNILLHDGKIKIADFGFCKSLETNKDLAHTMLGSPIYMAPEVLKGEIYTVRADVWSLGVVLYQMLYGFCPYEESSIARLINLLDQSQLSFNKEINTISPTLEDLIRKMLTKDQFRRITWDEIFSYRIGPEGISKPQTELREARNFFNHSSEVKLSFDRPSANTNSINTYSIDKKPIQTSTNDNFFKKKVNKENINIHDGQSLRNQHLKLVSAVRTIVDVLSNNYCPDLTIPLSQKMLTIIQKEVTKLAQSRKDVFQKQLTQLAETIKVFAQASGQTISSSQQPLVTQYIQSIQKTYPGAFSASDSSKDITVHLLDMLDFNNLEQSALKSEKMGLTKDMLIGEINQRMMTNVI